MRILVFYDAAWNGRIALKKEGCRPNHLEASQYFEVTEKHFGETEEKYSQPAKLFTSVVDILPVIVL